MSTKWRKYTETCTFLCFHVNSKHASTKTCVFHLMLTCTPPPPPPLTLHYKGKRSIHVGDHMIPSLASELHTCRAPPSYVKSAVQTLHCSIDGRGSNIICNYVLYIKISWTSDYFMATRLIIMQMVIS